MDDWLRNPALWPVLASPLAVAGALAMAAGSDPGPAGGAGFLAGWALTIPFGRAAVVGARARPVGRAAAGRGVLSRVSRRRGR